MRKIFTRLEHLAVDAGGNIDRLSIPGRKGGVKGSFFLMGLTSLVCLALISCSRAAPEKDLEVQGRKLISHRPPFTLMLPLEFQLMHSSSIEYPKENSLTRSYFLIRQKEKQVEEMFILQIADKTNPQAEPMNAPPLRPDSEKSMYLKDTIKKGDLVVDLMVQLMTWSPDAPSLLPIVEKGIVIPSHWAIQGQFLFVHQGEHAVFVRYSKDVRSFGLKVSEKGKDWERDSISGNERKVCETFQKTCIEMINSIRIKPL